MLTMKPANLFLFRANFERRFPVVTAQSAREGLAILEKQKDEINVVISDMSMPLQNGVDFIREAHQLVNRPISYYILSGFDFNDEVEEALNEGLIKKFLTKPFDDQEIEQLLTGNE